MKSQVLDISKQGNLGGEALKMRIDENSLDFIMGILSNLYSDPELAVIRELSVNARDSHIEAGQTRPIEITTPNWMSPFFRVQDFGVGLSLEDIENIYSAYGASTKRDTNEQTGSLGLGSKSPLTLTDQFTVISNKNGLKISVVVSRTETGGGTMQIVDTTPTDEPNGVTIIVPTQGGHAFEEKVKLFFRFWEPGRALVNDKEPWHDDDLVKITDTLFIKPGGRYNREKDYIIMGGIGYPTEKLIPERNRYNKVGFSIFAHVPIGSVAFTPSREELHYTQKTLAVIEGFTEEFRENIGKVITADVEGAEDREAAWKAYMKWEGMVGSSNITVPPTYKGESIPKGIKGKAAWYTANQHGNAKKKTVDFEEDFIVGLDKFYDNEYYRPIFVTNLPDDKYTTYTKGKVRAYCENNDYRAAKVIFTNDKALYESPWLPAGTIVLDWDEVKKATRPPSQKRATHKQFPALNGSSWANEDVDAAKKTVYYVPSWSTSGISFVNLYSIYHDSVQFFKIATNREERFKKLFPNAITLAEFATAEKKKWDDELKWHELHHLHGTFPGWIHMMPVEKIDDPEVKAYILASKESSRHDEWRALSNALANANQGSMKPPARPSNPLDKYPLIAHLDIWRVSTVELISEIATYMNGKYKELSA